MKIATKVNSNIESVKTKDSEKLFYEHLEKYMTGIGIPKIVPIKGIYFDLLYVENGNAALFKFMDTSEDTFSILSEEIIEVIEEELAIVDEFIKEKFEGLSLNYHFVMPFIEFESYNLSKEYVIDKSKMESLMNEEIPLSDLLSDTKGMDEELLFQLGKEYFVLQKESALGELVINKKYRNEDIKATLMEVEQIQGVNSLRYGTTLFEGATGTGKTSMMIAKLIKLARIYQNDNFLYVTFDKQLSNEINNMIKYYHKDINNIKVINFHQFVLILGRKYNLKLNNKSKQSFNKEFEKVFEKIAKIYKGKRYFKGVFVDEGENFNTSEIQFLRDISYSMKNILYIAYDEAKRMSPFDEHKEDASHFPKDNLLVAKGNYRMSQEVGYFNLDFQNDVNTFSVLELNRHSEYFKSFNVNNPKKGFAQVLEHEDTPQMLSRVIQIIKDSVGSGYDYSDICIIYPFNEKVVKNNKSVYSKHLLKKVLDENNILVNFADDESSYLQKPIGVTLSNIYNCTNLEWKVVILCQLDTLYNTFTKPKTKDIQKMLNIIYTATGRTNENLYVLIRKDDHRPGIIDLLSQKI